MRTDRCRQPKRRGAAYVLALVTMLVGSVLALAMLQAGYSYFLNEDSRSKKQAAIDMAQAAVDYAYWQVHYGGKPLPFATDVTLSTGSFHVNAMDDGNRDPSTMLIMASATCNGHSYSIRRVTLGLLPYHYAWCERGKIVDNDTISCTATERGIRANDDVNLGSVWNNITSGIWSTGQTNSLGTAYPRNPWGPPIAFPDINYSYYSSIATITYNSDVTLSSLYPTSDAVIYVNGNVTLNLATNKYRNAITIVATGNITIRTNLIGYDSNSYIALITDKTITVQSGPSSVNALLYAHRSDNGAKVQVQGATNIVGCMAADDTTTSGPLTINRNPSLDLNVMRRLHLPGL